MVFSLSAPARSLAAAGRTWTASTASTAARAVLLQGRSNSTTTTAAKPAPKAGKASGTAGWSAATTEALSLMHNQTKYAAIVEIKNRPYHVAKNDVIVAPRMNDLRLGDVIELDRVREISSPDYVLQGNPYVDPRYFRIRASVVEHAKSKEIVRKHTKRSGDSKTVSNANSHTLLRICEMDIVKTPSQ